MSYGVKRSSVVIAVLLVAVIVIGIIDQLFGQQYTDICVFQENIQYQILYLNSPVTYQSNTDKVIWLSNGCGYNIKDMYEKEDPKKGRDTQCFVEEVEQNGGPFFKLYLPMDYEKYCPAKPLELTPIPHLEVTPN